jgi:DNA-binding NtrC family response regulator
MKTVSDSSRSDSGSSWQSLPSGPARLKALVVDDEDDVLETTAAVIEAMGYQALRANNAAAAMDLLKTHPDIGVMFTDVLMPDVSGVHLGRTARELNPNIDVILVSGYPATAMEGNEGEPQEFKFLMKPIEASEIALILRRLGHAGPQR